MTDQNQDRQEAATIAIENLDQFANLIRGWHHNGMSQLDHLQNIPSGETITIQLEAGADPEELLLEGDALKGFKAAIIVAMNIFAELPFGAVPKPEEDAPASGN
jgi:hypothetical protein